MVSRTRQPISEWAFSAFIALTIAGYPLTAFLVSVFGVESRVFSIPFRVTLLVLCIFLIASSVVGRRAFTRPSIAIVMLAFWFIYSWKLVVAIVLDESRLGMREPVEYLWLAFGTVVIPMVAAMFVYPRDAYRKALYLTWILCVAASAGFLLSIPFGYAIVAGGRVALTSLNTISAGHLGVSTTSLGLFLLVAQRRSSFGRVMAFGLGSILGVIVMVLAGARGPALALMATGGCLGSIAMKRRSGRWLVVLAAVAIFSVPWLTKVLSIGAPDGSLPIVSRLSETSLTHGPRIDLWTSALRVFWESPVLGAGVVDPEVQSYPHNLLIESLMATGVIGGALFGLLFLTAVHRSLSSVRRTRDLAWIGILFIQYAVGAMFSGGLYGSSRFWILLGVVIAVSGQRPHAPEYQSLRGTLPAGFTPNSVPLRKFRSITYC